MFGLFSNPTVDNSSERKLSRELIKDARKFIAMAEAETRNANEARNLTLSADDQNFRRNLANIAIWHHEVSVKYYRKAAARYLEASVLRPDQENLLRKHSENLIRLAQEAESTVEFLRDLKN